MAFDLEIEFVGLCLFVTEPGAQSVDVLMPAAGTCGHAGKIDPHVVRLCVDTAYLVPGSAAPSGVVALVAMDGVDLSFGASGSLTPGLPSTVVNVGAVAGRPISSVALGANPASQLSGRVKLLSGECTGHNPGMCWTYDGKLRRLSNRVTWTVAGYGGEQLALTGTAFENGTLPEIPTLYPTEEGVGSEVIRVIKVSLYHTTRDELPPGPMEPVAPERGTPADHFSAFYTLFEPPVDDGPIPEFYGATCLGPIFRGGGSPYTCMAAQSPPL